MARYRLTESRLRNMIREAVKSVLYEAAYSDGNNDNGYNWGSDPLHNYTWDWSGYGDKAKEKYGHHKVGDVVTTEIAHDSLSTSIPANTKVKVIGVDPMRGYDIVDGNGTRCIEIGWRI